MAESRDVDAQQRLSALMDGEVGSREAAAACANWRHDAQARADWHAWHVIGDVLRSDDLAAAATRDAAFLARLGEALAKEPVLLAPASSMTTEASPDASRLDERAVAAAARPAVDAVALGGAEAVQPTLPAPAPGWLRQWGAPAAVAAAFMLVVGAVVTLPAGKLDGRGASVQLAQNASTPAAGGLWSAFAPGGANSLNASSGDSRGSDPAGGFEVVRDPRLERYLAAHQAFAGSTVLGSPTSFMRAASYDASGR